MQINLIPRFILQHQFDRKLFLIILFSSLFIQAALIGGAIFLYEIYPKPHFPNHMSAQVIGYFIVAVFWIPSNLIYLLWHQIEQMQHFNHFRGIINRIASLVYLWVILGFLLNTLFQYMLIHYFRQRRRRRRALAPPINLPDS